MALQIPTGIDDFRKLREARLEYVDKTSLIRELIDRSGVEVVHLQRPRRFGKTLNLSSQRGAEPASSTGLRRRATGRRGVGCGWLCGGVRW